MSEGEEVSMPEEKPPAVREHKKIKGRHDFEPNRNPEFCRHCGFTLNGTMKHNR